MIKLVDIAPEREGADGFITRAKELCRVSMAHTEADYEEARAAFGKGVMHVTHLFNAMTGLNHRAPGAVGAVLIPTPLWRNLSAMVSTFTRLSCVLRSACWERTEQS